jgi:hypothetical protein
VGQLIGCYRAYRWKAIFESGISGFDLNHHDGLSIARYKVRLKTDVSPVGREYA